MRKRTNIFGIIALLAVSLLAACSTGPKSIDHSVTMSDFAFNPAQISVPAGSQVNLTLVNDGTLAHEFVIIKKGLQVNAPFEEDQDEDKIYWENEVEAGETESEAFSAPEEPGEYQIICGIAGHLEQGMQGTLTVTQ
jgi:plastocyanin